ncbi:hypothetical protein BDV19DRAFT_395681 [Aspergillus venezuelensis]
MDSRISFKKSTQPYLADFKARCDMINSRSFMGYMRLGAETTAAKTNPGQQYDFGTPRMKAWTEDQGIWWWLEGNSQVGAFTSKEEPVTKRTFQYPNTLGVKELMEEYIKKLAWLS